MSYHVENYKYIYDLPYTQRIELCEILNQTNDWEELAVNWMGFSVLEIQKLRLECNPADEVLKKWGQRNHTIYELFVILSKMQNYPAMLPLKNFVSSRLHILMYDFEENPPDESTLTGPGQYSRKDAFYFDQCSDNLLNSMSTIFTTLPSISYYELAASTDNWNKENLLGKGGFGKVFKGLWKNTEVAIKKIEPRGFDYDENYALQLEQSFKEITILNSLPHQNILSLYAYSMNGVAPCLVYQFMMNGSLADRLHLKNGTVPLDWTQRQEIAVGTARGLQYLHTIHNNPLIHGDIKSANILLDKNFEPKIGDFGLAKAGSWESPVIVNKILGTRFYLPEEYLVRKKLSPKIDTYSYGIVLLELATGLPAYVKDECKSLKEHVDSFEEEDLHQLKDTQAGEVHHEAYDFLMKLGKWCSNRKDKDRPYMTEVYEKFH